MGLRNHAVKSVGEMMSETADSWVLIERDKAYFGLVVDSVEDVLDIHSNAIERSPEIKSGKASRYICGLAKIGNEVTILLDINTVINGAR